ncbi:MAG: dihydroorotase [Candidatus Omnitrophica bacterium]|nr:dihydroorotase [Candidatus Omnitrophota bacterium]MDD5488344.1 dihydroorotase [Candidatus Omnitrophota bacterium]
MKMLIKNGWVVDPSCGRNAKYDILIEKDRISKIGKGLEDEDAVLIDAKGKIVAPGFVDMHTHLREPGREEAETIATGMNAAVSGGYTTVCPMPNTEPACDSHADVTFLLERARDLKKCNLLPIGAITKKREGLELSEMAELKEAGCVAVSDDGSSVPDASLMRRALEYASMNGLLVISHCEDKALAGDGVMNEGYFSTLLGLAPIPREAEITVVERDIRLAELTGARLHIAHVSTAESIDIIKKAKKRGVNVTCEVTPHHFTLTDGALRGYDTDLKVNPPLRTAEDVKAIKEAIEDGTIDVIATDHAPHPENEKEKEFDYAPFGMIGLETALSLGIQELVDGEYLNWEGLVDKMSTTPSRILGYDRGTLQEGAVADIVIVDPEKEWVYSADKIRSKSKNSPFIGKKMKGAAVYTICGGKIVYKG